MHVAILAAGYGTRLYPLTLKVAKPLIPINNKPIINFLIDKIEALSKDFSIEGISVVVNNKFYKSFCDWKKEFGIKADIINDGSNSPDDRLGAVGDLKLAIGRNKTDWLILGGDNLFEDDLAEFLRFALDKRPSCSLGIYDVKYKSAARRFGVVLLNGRNRVLRLQEKPSKPVSTLAASCVYFFPKQSLNLLDLFVSTTKKVDASGKYIEWLAQKDKVFGYVLKGKWIDIGHFDNLKTAEKEFKV